MADITTNVSPPATIETFERPPDLIRDQTGLARAAVTFASSFSSTGTGAGDKEALNINLNLPPNYFYRPLVLSCSLNSVTSAFGGAWDNVAYVQVQSNLENYYCAMNYTTYRIGVTGNSYGLAWGTGSLSEKLAGQLIDGRNVPQASRDPVVTIGLSEITGSQAASSNFRVFARFLQYDVAQGFNDQIWSVGNELT